MSTPDLVWAVVAVIAGLGAGWWSYWRLPLRLTAFQRGFLLSLRGLVIAGLLWLLADPVLRLTRPISEKPLLLLLADDSKSLFWGASITPQFYQERLNELVKALERAGYAVEARRFDTEIHPWDTFSGKGEGTALYQALIEMREAFPEAEGAILISDGIDNGSNRIVSALGLPLWTVGAGPQTPITDAAIEKVILPPWWEAGRGHEVEARFSMAGPSGTLVVQTPSGSRSWPLPPDISAFRIPLSFAEAGYVPVTFRLEVPGDPNPANNTYTTVISVRPATPRIAIWAGEITPDIAFLRRSLERIGRVTLLLAKKPVGLTITPDTLSWREYAIHVLYNFPLRGEDTAYVRQILDSDGVPWVIWGPSVSEAFVRPYLSRLGWQSLGPLRGYPLSKEATLLLRTEYLSPSVEKIAGPVGPWAYRHVRGNRAAAGLLGEGWWQLRSMPAWVASWDSLVSELTAWSLLFYRASAYLLPQRTRYQSGEAVVWTGQAPPSARLSVKRPSGRVDTLAPASGVSYRPPESGLYTYQLWQDRQKLHEGAFWVEAISPEMQRLGIDTLALRLLATQNRGAFLPWDSLGALPLLIQNAIPPQTLVHLHTEILPFHEWWPWLLMLLGLLSFEWLLRRYWGLY